MSRYLSYATTSQVVAADLNAIQDHSVYDYSNPILLGRFSGTGALSASPSSTIPRIVAGGTFSTSGFFGVDSTYVNTNDLSVPNRTLRLMFNASLICGPAPSVSTYVGVGLYRLTTNTGANGYFFTNTDALTYTSGVAYLPATQFIGAYELGIAASDGHYFFGITQTVADTTNISVIGELYAHYQEY